VHAISLSKLQTIFSGPYLAYDWIVSSRHFVKDAANSLQPFLILSRYSIVLLVIKLQRPALHSNMKQGAHSVYPI